MSNFQSAQFIAYHVPTFKNVNPGAVDPNSAVGKGLPADEQALVQRFAGVLNLAKTLPEVDSSAHPRAR